MAAQQENSDPKERTRDVLIEERIDFNSLLLSQDTLGGLKKNGFYKPSPIQLKAIPIGRCGFDLIVEAKSGTGKTAVFAIIALEMINVKKNSLQVLILAPTREIAVQVTDVINTLGVDYNGLKTACFIGGLSLEDDITNLQHCHIAVGAPGRVKHLIEKGHLKTESIRLFVLDEADKLMESSYQADINQIYHKLPSRKQMLALSATYPDDLDKFLANYMLTPTHISPKTDSPLLLGLKHFVSVIKSSMNVMQQMNIKVDELIRLLSKISFTQCLIFSNYQTQAESVSNILTRKGWESTYISGAQSQPERLQALKDLKQFKKRILLSTDLTARGIDAVNVDLVINYDVPYDASTYLHRMGRAGRYGSKGLCVSLSAKGKELDRLQNILGVIGGTTLSISKLPDNESFPSNIWEADLDTFEQIFGRVVAEVSNFGDIKKSIFDLKNSKMESKGQENTNKENTIKKNNKGKFNNIKGSEDHSNKLDDNTEDINQCEFDPQSILEKLANGEIVEPLELPEETENFDTSNILELLNSDDFPNSTKRKRSDIKSQSLENMHKEKRKNIPKPSTESIYENNMSLFNVTKLLMSGEISCNIQPDVSKNINSYINKLRDEDSANIDNLVDILKDKSCEEILDNVDHIIQNCDDSEKECGDTQIEDIFTNSYDYALNRNPEKTHWLDVFGETLEENVEPEEEKINLLECIEDGYEEEDSEGMFAPQYKNKNRKKHWNRGKYKKSMALEEIQRTEVIDHYNYPPGLYGTHEYAESETFTTSFNNCSDTLAEKAFEFEDVDSFDSWFLKWQHQVQSVRDYVQQNIYFQEMNRYQYYRN